MSILHGTTSGFEDASYAVSEENPERIKTGLREHYEITFSYVVTVPPFTDEEKAAAETAGAKLPDFDDDDVVYRVKGVDVTESFEAPPEGATEGTKVYDLEITLDFSYPIRDA